MSVQRKKNGTYLVRWRDQGKQYGKCFKRKLDADHFDAKIMLGQVKKIDLIDASNRSSGSKLTFRDFSRRWLNDYAKVHKTPSSVVRDMRVIDRHFLPRWADRPLQSIRRSEIVKFQADLNGKLRPKTINNAVGQLKKMLGDAVEWGLIEDNPATSIKQVRVLQSPFGCWSEEESKTFLNYVESVDPFLFNLVGFTLNTGLRKGEIKGLLVDAVNFATREINVFRAYCQTTYALNEYTKGKRPRIVPMNDFVYQILQTHCEGKGPSDPVFECDFHNIIRTRLRPMQEAAGVPTISFHDLRHSFATQLMARGVSIYLIKELLGHADLKTTSVYMHVNKRHLIGVTDALAAYWRETRCAPKVHQLKVSNY